MFNNCEFILGDNNSIVIVIPTQLPRGKPLTIEVHNKGIIFKSGENAVGDIICEHADILDRLISQERVGMIESLNGSPEFPAYISAVALIEIRSAL